MKDLDNTPLWVKLAYANVSTRKMALWLTASSALFTFYCVPWNHFFRQVWVNKLFLLHDWSWVAMMVPMVIWYYVSLKWVDKHAAWE